MNSNSIVDNELTDITLDLSSASSSSSSSSAAAKSSSLTKDNSNSTYSHCNEILTRKLKLNENITVNSGCNNNSKDEENNELIDSKYTKRQSGYYKILQIINQSNKESSDNINEKMEPIKTEKIENMEKKESNQAHDATGSLSKYFRIEQCRYDIGIYLNSALLLKKFKRDQAKHQAPADHGNRNPEVLPNMERRKTEIETNETEFIPQNEEELPEHARPTLKHTSSMATETQERRTNTSMYGQAPNVKTPKQKIKYKSLKEKKLTYELALSTLKFESIFEKILEETAFFIQYPDFREEDQVVLVIFNDYVKRKFQKRSAKEGELEGGEGNNAILIAADIEQCIFSMRIKLNAAVMRTRVRHGVRSLNQMLPEQYRMGEEFAEKMLVYMWYNSNTAANADIVHHLTDYGFKRVSSAKTLEQNEFYQDRHCSDLYVFHHDDRDFLQESDMVVRKKIAVVQDKSTSLAIHCFISNIVQGEEIAIINPTTLLTAVHIEGLLKNKFGSVVPLAPIRVFRTPKEDDDHKLLPKMGSTSIKIHTEDIMTLDSTNEKYRFIKHVFFQAKCTRSGVVSPIDFLDTEQDDISLLKDYAMRASLDGAKPTKISDSIVRNSMILRQCFRFTSIRAVTYLTHSIYDEENEILVNKAVDLINKVMMKDTMEPNGKYECFSNVPPNLPMLVDDLTEHGILRDKNIMYPPSSETNGFFIAIFAKEYKYMTLENIEVAAEEKSKKKKKKGAKEAAVQE